MMQSQLEAALLGHASGLNASANIVDNDDESNFQDEEEDVEDFIDEEVEGGDGNGGQRIGKPCCGGSSGGSSTTRTVTLQMLLSADILQPGKGTMTIEYLGQRFVGDLLEGGKIRSQETDIVFASPSAWAIACKRFINPDKKSGCGWASVKYRGRKLDAYKNVWYKKKKEALLNQEIREGNFDIDTLVQKTMASAMPYHHRVVVKHNTIANRTLTHDANTLIECIPFSNLGKIQPFLVSLSTNAALLMDFHCHLTRSEVSGYLAGHWDINTHNLQITHAFPCRNTKADRENAPTVESDISKAIDKEKLILVGWYHSHPYAAAAPTLRDVDAQLDYQIRMKGTSDNSYTPCIGIIISPYNYENTSLESSIIAYWVIPPPETKPNEYGRPMLMSYSVIQDTVLSHNAKEEMSKCADYYKKEPDFVNFNERYLNTTNTYVDKLKSTLISKFPRDESETALWRFIRESVGCHFDESDNTLLSIPSIGKTPPIIPNLNSSNFLPSDISSLLFNSGKFPSASSLLGLPDPMAHSTLAANNMFLSTNLFKMQELLKPLSSSSPIPAAASSSSTSTSTSTGAGGGGKKNEKHTSLKIPTDYSTDYLGLKGPTSKIEFVAPEAKTSPKTDFSMASDLSISRSSSKQEFSVSDLSKSSSISMDYGLNLSQLMDLACAGGGGAGGGGGGGQAGGGGGEKLPKYPKTSISAHDYSMLDLSFPKSAGTTSASEATDLSMNMSEELRRDDNKDDNMPLNLTA